MLLAVNQLPRLLPQRVSPLFLRQTRLGFSSSLKSSPKPNPSLWKSWLSTPLSRRMSQAAFGQLKDRLQDPRLGNIPEKAQRLVGWWLMGMAGMCFGAVVLGGITRLTESGLSMTHWHLVKEMPPFTHEDWEREFERYKEFPEYKHVVNSRGEMSLSDFQFIWWMEYIHRMWGRSIGVAFLVPASYFAYRGWFAKAMQKRVVFLGGFLLFQGFLGWYMVRSGLVEKTQPHDTVPRVSQYRLAAHLASAFGLYSLFFWNGLTHLTAPTGLREFSQIRKLRGMTHGMKALIFATAVTGAFVAGLDAGLTYNSWPKMADRWVPSDIWIPQLGWRNLFENPTMVQFIHRRMGELTTLGVTALWWTATRASTATMLPKRAQVLAHALLGMVLFQATLGITTLLNYVPVSLAASHQSGSLVLLSLALAFSHTLRRMPK